MTKIKTPKSEEEMCALVKEAAHNKQTLKIIGGGTRPIGNPIKADATISASGLSGVSLYEPGALTLVAKAGTSVEEIQKVLAKENQHLPFEPADYQSLLGTKGDSTIGGVIAGAISGPRRIQVGAVRDALIGVRFIDGEGNAIKNGGRVMKNVTGYDLVKLFAGSFGTLGILSEVSFKVLPKVESTNTLILNGLTDEKAILSLSKALGSPYDISGAAHLSADINCTAQTLIRVEGLKNSVTYRTEQLKELLFKYLGHTAEIDVETSANKSFKIWQNVRDVKAFKKPNKSEANEKAIWKISVKPTNGYKLVEALQKNIIVTPQYDWGGGLVWLAVDQDNLASATLIRHTVQSMGGHATLITADQETLNQVEVFHPQVPRIAKIAAQLRTQFDPNGIFNPHLLEKASTAKMREAS